MSKPENPEEEEKVPEGMERRKRRVRKRRKNQSESSKDAGHLFSKAKDLLVGMEQDQDESFGPVTVSDQVKRLQRKDEDDKPLDEVWGSKKRSTSWLWIVLCGLIIPVVAIVIGVVKLTSGEGADDDLASVNREIQIQEVGFDASGGPLGWYNEDSLTATAKVREIIEKVNEAESAEEILPYLRSSPDRGARMPDLARWGSPLLTNSLSGFGWSPDVVKDRLGTDETGVLRVFGTRADRSNFEISFVSEQGQIKLDWEASVGWSETALEELITTKPLKETLIRCLIEKKPSYDQAFGLDDYSGFILSEETGGNFTMAYVPLKRKAHEQLDSRLKLVLNYGSFTGQPLLRDQRVTLRVRFNPEVGRDGIFEILELEHAGWTRP